MVGSVPSAMPRCEEKKPIVSRREFTEEKNIKQTNK